jgi:hypothetical protein
MVIDMEINKAHWSSDNGHVRMSMPINKVDVERRIVSGFATLDNLDKQGDVVPAEASVKAFNSFRGNIREMHSNKAVGRMVSFKEDTYFDPESKKFYNGIVVSAYVSKGAQDTWEKVLDGTLTGFSIGGEIHDAEKVYDEELGKAYQVIKEYSLSELSLVDNPANQFANVFSIEKGEMHGYLAKADIDNVFWCRKDDIVQMSKDSTSDCPQCDSTMSNIGFVESNDVDKASVVKSMILGVRKSEILKGIEEGTYVKFDGSYGKVMEIIFKGGARLSTDSEPVLAKSDDPVVIIREYSQIGGTIVPTNRRVIKNVSSLENVNAINKSEVKEVSKMDSDIVVVDEIEKSDSVESVETPVAEEAEVVETAKAEEAEVVKAEDAADEEEVVDEEATAEKAEMPETEKGDTDDVAAQVSKAVSEINETLATALSTLAETVKALDAKIEGINKSVTGAVAGIESKVEEVKDSFGKRVDAVEKDTAFRKSADLGEILQEEPVIMQKSVDSAWGGRFLTNADLFR